jgi:hypothetical protein
MKTTFPLILAILSPAFVLAADSSANAPLVSKDWANAAYLEARVTVHGTTGFKPGENLIDHIDWKEDRDGDFFRRLQQQRFGKPEFDMLTAFNGSVYYSLDTLGGISQMQTSRAVPAMVENFYNEAFPLDSYKFLIETGTATNTRYPGVNDLASFSKLGAAMSGTKQFKAGTFEGAPALSLEFPGGLCWEGQKIGYTVYFEPADSHKLLGWECTHPDGTLYSALFVDQWQSVGLEGFNNLISYPSRFRLRCYRNSSSLEQGITYEYVNDVQIDKVTAVIDRSNFSIDPAQADYIYDRDSKTQIHNQRP